MLVNGYMIREAIRRHELRRNTLQTQVESALFTFEDEEKMSANDVVAQLAAAEQAICELMVVQDRYNLTLSVVVQGKPMYLAKAVKLVGSAGRVEKIWRTWATHGGKRSSYDSIELTRNKDEVRAKRTLSPQECLDGASKAAAYAGALRSAIATANSKDIDLIELDPKLFE